MKRLTRFFLALSIFGIFIFFLFFLFQVFLSHLFYLKGKKAIEKGEYASAVEEFKNALHYNASNFRTWDVLGNTYRLSANNKPLDKALEITLLAKKAFEKATRLNPLESSLFFHLASTEALIEKLSLYTGQTLPGDAVTPLLHFQKAIQLAPHTAQYHIALSDYLWDTDQIPLLEKTLRDLGRIYPRAYYQLKTESFWSKNLETAFKSGMEQAVEHNATVESAHEVLSHILEKEERFQEAIFHFRKRIGFKTEIKPYDHIHLGKLYVAAGDTTQAEQSFIKALESTSDRIETLESIYWTCENLEKLGIFLSFFEEAKNKGLIFSKADLYAAKAHMELNNLVQAKEILIPLSRRHPSGEVFHLLAEIAEDEKDWDTMERFIQKATVQDPKNYWYHFKFSDVLKRQKKLDEAEKEAGLAIENSDKPRSWLYSHRAWIRWQKNDYPGAFADWDEAAKLDFENPDYLHWAGNALYRMGKWEEAARYFQRAIGLDPDNLELKAKHDALLKDLERIRK